MRKPIILASQSRYKRALFQRLNLPFEAVRPKFREHIAPDLSPPELAVFLAQEKARSLVDAYPHHLIVGSDQVLSLEGEIMTKPGTVARAVDQLHRLLGKTHELHTAYALFDTPQPDCCSRVVSSRITFYDDLTTPFLHHLVVQDETQDCVGSYKFEAHGILLVQSVETADANAILGLPLIALIADLRRLGYYRQSYE